MVAIAKDVDVLGPIKLFLFRTDLHGKFDTKT